MIREENKMEKEITNNPTLGAWDKLPTEFEERKPKIEFEVNKPVEVIFLDNEPTEMQGDTGAYYIFNVEQNKEKKVIMTSAWSLLRILKTLTPLAGKRVKITKVMEKGKQHFEANVVEGMKEKLQKADKMMQKVGDKIEKILG